MNSLWIRRGMWFSFAIYTIVVLLFFAQDYYRRQQEFYKNIDQYLLLGANTVGHLLPSRLHDLSAPPTEEEDQKNIQLLSKLAEQGKFAYLYTMVLNDGIVHFTSSSATNTDVQDNAVSHFGDTYDEASEALRNSFHTFQPVFENTVDRWGSFRSVFIPIKGKDGHSYVIAADYPTNQIQQSLQTIVIQHSIGAGLLIFLALTAVLAGSKSLQSLDKTNEELSFLASVVRQMDYGVAVSVGTKEFTWSNQALERILGSNPTQTLAALVESPSFHTSSSIVPFSAVPGITHVQIEQQTLNSHFDTTLIWTVRDFSVRQALEDRLRRARQDAEKASSARRDFLANMTHELRTPMFGVLGMLELLERSVLPPLALAQVQTASRSASLLLQLVDDLLDLTKMESGKLVLENTSFRLREILHDVVELTKLRAKPGVSLYTEIDETLPRLIMGDPTRIKQVLYNLIGNGLKFTRAGSVTLSVSRPEPGTLQLRVIDTGIGISETDLSKLFRPFVQADPSTSRRFGGSGLGLAIVRHLVEQMDGTLTAESRVDQGSTFTVTLPLTEGTKEPLSVLKGTSTPQVGVGKTVLIVDDQAINREITSAMTSVFGACAIGVSSGKEALACLTTQAVDLILLDVQMPEMDGYETVTHIRARGGRYSSLPVIGLSASNYAEDRQKGLDAGMNDYAAKPISIATLGALLEKYFGEPKQAAPSSLSPQIQLLDIRQLEQLRILGPQILAILQAFQQDVEQKISKLTQCLTENNFSEAGREIHSLKGAASSIGALALTERCKAFERGLAAQEYDLLGPILEEIAFLRQPTLEALENTFRE